MDDLLAIVITKISDVDLLARQLKHISQPRIRLLLGHNARGMELVKVTVRFLAQIAELFIRHCAERNGRAGDHAHIGVTNGVFAAYVQLCMMRIGFVYPVCAA